MMSNLLDDLKPRRIYYESLQPHQKKFWDVVETLLKMGITPTPKVVNEALHKPIRTSWNGPLCAIRTQLLEDYGYGLVSTKRGIGTGMWRWKKMYKDDAPNLIADDNGKVIGCVTRWNPYGGGEMLIQYFDGSADTTLVGELNFPNGKEQAIKYCNSKEL